MAARVWKFRETDPYQTFWQNACYTHDDFKLMRGLMLNLAVERHNREANWDTGAVDVNGEPMGSVVRVAGGRSYRARLTPSQSAACARHDRAGPRARRGQARESAVR